MEPKADSQLWADLKRCLPYRTTPEQTALRKKIWESIDMNNNGYLSLAEIDKGLRDVVRIPQLFDTKPVIMRAFQKAKNRLKAKGTHGDDYVSKAEFRYLLMYLRQYYEYWVAFERIDKNFDRRIEMAEFKAAVPVMARWKINITDPQKTFADIDKNGGGYILFDEFCDWAIKKNMDLDDDDDENVEW